MRTDMSGRTRGGGNIMSDNYDEKMKETGSEKKTETAASGNASDTEKKLLFWSRVTGISAMAAALCLMVAAFALISFAPQVRELLAGFEEISAELKDMSTEITRVLRSLNEQGLSEIYGTLDNIQQIDIQRLNDSIDSLYRIIDPLASLFG